MFSWRKLRCRVFLKLLYKASKWVETSLYEAGSQLVRQSSEKAGKSLEMEVL